MSWSTYIAVCVCVQECGRAWRSWCPFCWVAVRKVARKVRGEPSQLPLLTFCSVLVYLTKKNFSTTLILAFCKRSNRKRLCMTVDPSCASPVAVFARFYVTPNEMELKRDFSSFMLRQQRQNKFEYGRAHLDTFTTC